MSTKRKALRSMLLFLLIAAAGSSAFAGPAPKAAGTSITVVPGFTRVVVSLPPQPRLPIPAVPTIPRPGVPFTGIGQVSDLLPTVQQVACPQPNAATHESAARIDSCPSGGGQPPQERVYWWKGTWKRSDHFGTWYAFTQEFQWHTYGAKITKVDENFCYRAAGAWNYIGCGRPNGPYNGTPYIVQKTGTNDRVLAEWKFCAHGTSDGCQWPHTDITFGADGSVAGTVWFQ